MEIIFSFLNQISNYYYIHLVNTYAIAKPRRREIKKLDHGVRGRIDLFVCLKKGQMIIIQLLSL